MPKDVEYIGYADSATVELGEEHKEYKFTAEQRVVALNNAHADELVEKDNRFKLHETVSNEGDGEGDANPMTGGLGQPADNPDAGEGTEGDDED